VFKSIAFEWPVDADMLPPVAPAEFDVVPPAEAVLPPALTPPPWLKLPAGPPTSTCAPQAVNMPRRMLAVNNLTMGIIPDSERDTLEALFAYESSILSAFECKSGRGRIRRILSCAF